MDILKHIMEMEGFSRFPYICPAGKLTIGYGRNLQDVGIYESEAVMLLVMDIERVNRELRINLPFFKDLDENRKKVLVDMDYNLGMSKLLQFENTLQAIRDRRWEDAAREMLDSKWAKQVGRRAEIDARTMREGRYG